MSESMFVDILLQGVGGMFGWDLSLQRIFGIVFWPLAWIMGIETKDCMVAGDLLGKKMVINEFVAYLEMMGGDFDDFSSSKSKSTDLASMLSSFSSDLSSEAVTCVAVDAADTATLESGAGV